MDETFSFDNRLEAVVAVSKSKKAVSAVEPAVIWIGLLFALIHQTQSSLPVVFEVILTG